MQDCKNVLKMLNFGTKKVPHTAGLSVTDRFPLFADVCFCRLRAAIGVDCADDAEARRL